MVLMVSEAAQGHIIPYLGGLVAEFDQPLIQLECYLRLFLVEAVGCDVGHCFDVTILHGECSLIILIGCF